MGPRLRSSQTSDRIPPPPAPLHARAGEPDAPRFYAAALLCASTTAIPPSLTPPTTPGDPIAALLHAVGVSNTAHATTSPLGPADTVAPPSLAAIKSLAGPVAHWLTSELFGALRDGKLAAPATLLVDAETSMLSRCPMSPWQLGELVACVHGAAISGNAGKTVLQRMLTAGDTAARPYAIAESAGLLQVVDEAVIRGLVAETLAHPDHAPTVAKFRSGHERAAGALVAAVLAKGGGRLHPGKTAAAVADALGPAPPRRSKS